MAGRGYARRHARFHRHENGLWRVLSVQRSQWGARDGTSFTLNLGIGSNARLRRLSPRSRPPREYECQLDERLPALLGGELPTTGRAPVRGWWEVEPGQDPAALAASVLPLVERFGLPWLDAYRTDLDLMEALIASGTALRAVEIAIAHDRLDVADAAIAGSREQIGRRAADADVQRWRQVLAELETLVAQARSGDA
jgi:hypothetical protein